MEHTGDLGEDLQIVRDGYAEEKGTTAEGTTFVFGANIDDRKAIPEGAAADIQSMHLGMEYLTFEGSVDYDAFVDDYNNRLTGNDGDNQLFEGGGDDILASGAGQDRLVGGDGSDDLDVGAGNDILDGGDDHDLLRGGAGDDQLRGGLGEDMLYGEAGDDSFILGLDDVAVNTIFDLEGANRLVLEGVTDEAIETSVFGDDLYVMADGLPVAMIKHYVGHEDSIADIDFGQGLENRRFAPGRQPRP